MKTPRDKLHIGSREWMVHYEVLISMGKAPLARFARSILRNHAKIHNTFCMGRDSDKDQYRAVILIEIDFRTIEDFIKEVKPIETRYRSPTRFNNGSIIPVYVNPEEELEARWQNGW